jgi:catechol 2,3-dioxygenase
VFHSPESANKYGSNFVYSIVDNFVRDFYGDFQQQGGTVHRERVRDIAHVGAVEILTPVPEESRDFFVDLMAMEEVARSGDSVYLHTWDDYERFTVKLTGGPTSGVGCTWLRAASPAALERRVRAIEETGLGEGWSEGEPGLGPVYRFRDPDGHAMGIYHETEWYAPDAAHRPALKNQASAFPGRGANVRRLDHVNYLAADVPATSAFVTAVLSGRPTEQIVLDDGVPSAVWHSVCDKSYDLVYTGDWTGANGRLHHVAFATDTREDILRAADVFLEAGIHIETGPHKHAIQQTFFLYVWEPGGNRVELCNAGARLLLAPDWETVSWTREEREKGQAWGLKTIETFHTHGTPPVTSPDSTR